MMSFLSYISIHLQLYSFQIFLIGNNKTLYMTNSTHFSAFSYLLNINWITFMFWYLKNIYIYCVGQFCPVFQLCERKGPAQYSVWEETDIRGCPPEEWTKLPSEERWNTFVRNGPCPRTMVASVLLSEVPGEFVNHSEQCPGRIL